MVAVSIKLSKRKISVIALCIALVGLIAFSVFGGFYGNSSAVNVGYDENNIIDYIKSFGWEIDETSGEGNDVLIPSEFNDVYKQYNALQLSQGFDLTKYRGLTVTRYTYNVTNYPDYPKNVKINLLVYEGRVIGGDICSISLDGFIVAFK
ncbi:MAG: DUF4830 domain-containing protein [Oscillospiraceae bacterium]|nr:DUF4830 domain-containing protein [Oscillospiraceae bacterium]